MGWITQVQREEAKQPFGRHNFPTLLREAALWDCWAAGLMKSRDWRPGCELGQEHGLMLEMAMGSPGFHHQGDTADALKEALSTPQFSSELEMLAQSGTDKALTAGAARSDSSAGRSAQLGCSLPGRWQRQPAKLSNPISQNFASQRKARPLWQVARNSRHPDLPLVRVI